MTITDEHIDYITTNLEFYGVQEGNLKDDLTDHICTYIEHGDFCDFETAYNEAIIKFGGHYAMGSLQRETYLMVLFKKTRQRQKLIYASGFLAAFLLSTGSIFKILHWPLASILLLAGFVVLNFIFMPVYFYSRYKTSGNKIYSDT